ncbi:MAG TPA: MFS transporter [Acidobacteriota bacterium]|nr:MFS transporter [Acidobacteriota bacterium]HNB69704.1 MFS transporter [Acidobacteriota bacterium]HNC43679.1 MFS transporter [Acidobacteriota bacterium]HNG91359.1 MFS transporter [Acidobacteriota bacterium]
MTRELPFAHTSTTFEALPDPLRWKSLTVLSVVMFALSLDGFLTYVAIPSMQEDLAARSAQMQLIVASFQIATASFLITGGRIGDLFGRKRMFILGTLGYAVCWGLCCLLHNIYLIIGLFVIQGLAGALISPQVLSILSVSFNLKERNKAFGFYNAALGSGALLGLFIGGAIVQWFGWRAIFLISVPIYILAALFAPKFLRESRAYFGTSLDLLGVGILALGLAFMVGSLVVGREAGWPPIAIVCLVGSIAIIGLFLRYEHLKASAQDSSPLIPEGLLTNRTYVIGLIVALLYATTQSSFYFTFVIFIQVGLKFKPLWVALTLTPMALGFISGSIFASQLTKRFGQKTLTIGIILMGLGPLIAYLTLLTNSEKINFIALSIGLMIQGAGMGLITTPLYNMILAKVRRAIAGAATGILTTVQQIGGALGIAIVGVIFFGILGSRQALPNVTQAQAYTAAFMGSLWYYLGVCVVIFVLLQFLPRQSTGNTGPLKSPVGKLPGLD